MSDEITPPPPPTTSPLPPPRNDGEERTVPMERFRAVVEAKNAGNLRIQELQEEVQKYAERAATADSLAKALEEGRAAWKTKETSYQEDMALLSSGLTDEEGRAVARTLYSRIPAEGRPKSLLEWIGSLREEGATLPRALVPYLTHQAKQTVSPPGNPTVTRPGAQPPLAPTRVTPEALNAATEQFKQGKISAEDLRAMVMGAKQTT